MADFGKLNFAVSFNPQTAFPLDARYYFSTLSAAQAAAAAAVEVGSSDGVFFYGENVCVVTDSAADLYIIQPDKTLKAVGTVVLGDDKSIEIVDGKVTLSDECLTPDSSRFWPAASYEEGKIQPSYDKQFVRNWLKANWDMTGETPHLPAEVIDGTSERYREAFQIITGSQFTSMKENA